MSDDVYVSPETLAERYGVPLSTVYSWNYKGTGPRPYRFGRHVRYLLSEVLIWEQGQRDRTGAPAA